MKAGAHSYRITLGRDLGVAVYRSAKKSTTATKVFLVFDANFYALHGRALERNWKQVSTAVNSLVIPSGEETKTRGTVEKIQDWAIGKGVAPDDILIACGGGVTSDIVGYSAATLFRGIKWGICSTTLLGMADASIGGKTGVNLASGKNLIGSYWQPSFVIDDLKWLETLPRRELNSGIAEIIKCAGLNGGELLKQVLGWAETGFDVTFREFEELILRTIRFKGSIVGQDERDRGKRLILNYGHTTAHGIEQSLGYRQLTHGEAVLLGMLVAAEVENELRIGSQLALAGFRHAVESAAVSVPRVRLSVPAIMRAIEVDKKRKGGMIRMVLMRRPGAAIVRDVDRTILRSAVTKITHKYGKR